MGVLVRVPSVNAAQRAGIVPAHAAPIVASVHVSRHRAHCCQPCRPQPSTDRRARRAGRNAADARAAIVAQRRSPFGTRCAARWRLRRRTPRPRPLRLTLAASRPLLSTLPPSAIDRSSGAACWTQRGSCARCGCGLAFTVMDCRTEYDHRTWVPCSRRRPSGGRRSHQGWRCMLRSFAADHGLTARSTGRADTRLLLGQHRRGPPVTLVRYRESPKR